MINRCPGQDRRSITAAERQCLSCGYKTEIFSDEPGVKCPACGNFVFNNQAASCLEWCSSARDCLGAKRWEELTGRRGGK